MYTLDNVDRAGLDTLATLPVAVNGLALGNAGLAVMFYNIFKFQGVWVNYMSLQWIVYAYAIFAIIIIIAYYLRIVVGPTSWYADDMSHPRPLSAIGAQAMALLILALLATIEELQFDNAVPLSLGIFGTAVQFIAMSRFLYFCNKEKCLPEPFFNAAIHSCMFVPTCLPSAPITMTNQNDPPLVTLKKLFMWFGLLSLVPSITTQLLRVLRDPEKVATNYTVCILQAACSISLTAWITFPLTGSAISGAGFIVMNCLFAMSTTVYFFVWIALYQRRGALYALGNHPTMSSATFPFSNSAISSNLYRVTMLRAGALSKDGQWILLAWVMLLSAVALTTTTAVTAVYVSNNFFMTNETTASSQTLAKAAVPAVVGETKVGDSDAVESRLRCEDDRSIAQL